MGEKHIGGLETVAPPAETGAAESYSVHLGQGRFHHSNLFKNFHLVVDYQPSSFAPNSYWSNKGIPHNINITLISDLDPVLPKYRTWQMYNYIAYWFSDAFVVAIWQMASAFLTSGLNWKQSLVAVSVGFILIAIPITFQGTMGARFNVPFPILVRSSFGMYLSYFCIISRSVLAMFWFGINSATGGTLTVQMIRAIWPSFLNIPNQLSASANITTQGMVGYFVL
jgi:nucleobase:cation symporter-1, NCS1 family